MIVLCINLFWKNKKKLKEKKAQKYISRELSKTILFVAKKNNKKADILWLKVSSTSNILGVKENFMQSICVQQVS